MIPIALPMMSHEEQDAATAVLSSGRLAQGPEVEKFEEEFAEFIGVDYAVAVSSGTSALFCACKSMQSHTREHVSVPAFTFVSTATAPKFARYHVDFVDVDPLTCNMDPTSESSVFVHLYGNPLGIRHHVEESRGFVIEDCAQAIGSEVDGQKTGSFGDVGTFSFYATKNMTSGGEGGMITTNSRAVANRCRLLRSHGEPMKYYHLALGFNFRMTELQAAIGRVQLRRLPEFNAARQANADRYLENIDVRGISCPVGVVGHTYHQFVLIVGDEFSMTRNEFVSYLNSRGVGTGVHYPTIVPHQPVFARSRTEQYPVSEMLSRSVVSIPVGPWLTSVDVKYIIDTINEVVPSE